MLKVHSGVVTQGFQFASGEAVGRAEKPSPFSKGTIELQHPYFLAKKLDLEALVPGLKRATINLELGRKLILNDADYSATIDWTKDEPTRIEPETFSFVHCCFVYPLAGGDGKLGYYPGLLYYPHPETKPKTNTHAFDVLEILTREVPGLVRGTPASVVCRADAFREL